MRAAVIGSGGLLVDDLGKYLPNETTEIVSGGAKGIDACTREYAAAKNRHSGRTGIYGYLDTGCDYPV